MAPHSGSTVYTQKLKFKLQQMTHASVRNYCTLIGIFTIFYTDLRQQNNVNYFNKTGRLNSKLYT